MSQNHVHDRELLEKVDAFITDEKPTGIDVIDEMQAPAPDPIFQYILEDKVIARLQETQSRQRIGWVNWRRWGFVAAAIAIFVVGGVLFQRVRAEDKQASVTLQTTEEFHIAVFRRYIDEAWNAGNLTVLDDLLARSMVIHDTTLPNNAAGRDTLESIIEGYRAGFPDLQVSISAISADDKWVWVDLVTTGTHTQPFSFPTGGILPPSDKPVSLSSNVVARYEDGKIAELWMQSDSLELLTELNVSKSPEILALEAQNIRVVQRVFDELWNTPDPILNTVRELFGNHTTVWFWSTDAPEQESDILTLAAFDGFRESFPDLLMTIENITADGDFVVVRYKAEGTFENEFCIMCSLQEEGLAATGELTRWQGTFTYRLENGVIRETWWHFDGGFTTFWLSDLLQHNAKEADWLESLE